MTMTTRQWIALMIGLWALFLTAQYALDGWPRVIAEVCVSLGFLASTIERFQNMRRNKQEARK